MNRLVVIGWLSGRTAYLNISREEAIARYMKSHGDEDPPPESVITEFEFKDEFSVYDASASE